MSFIKKHYHWLIAALVLIQLAIYGGTNNNLTLFFLPVSESFGVSRSAFSLAGSLKAISSVLGTFLSGVVLLRYGYRKSVLAFLGISALGLCTLSASNTLPVYFIGCVLFGLADGVCINAGPPRLVSAWFHRHQGTVLGAVTAATGLGGSLICLLLSGVIETSGWKTAYLIAAGLFGIVWIAMLFLVRDRPENMNLKPFGEGQRIVKKKEGVDHWSGYSFQQMRRSPAFYILIVGTFISCFFSGGILAVIIPHLQDMGLTASQAASIQSVMMLMLAAVKLGCGIFSDKVGAKWVMLVCLISTILCAAILPFSSSVPVAMTAAFFCAGSLPLTSVMIPLLSNALFGYQAQTACLSIVMAMVSLAGIVSGPTANMIFDKIGSYNPFFWLCAIGSGAMVLVYSVMYKLADRDKTQIIAEQESN